MGFNWGTGSPPYEPLKLIALSSIREVSYMPNAKESHYQAYLLLRELDAQIAATMNQIAYGRMNGIEWEKTCKAHRIAFDEWIKFADIRAAEGKDSASESHNDD